MEVITSSSNPKIKAFASLKEKKHREQSGLYLVEGLRSVSEYLQANVVVDAVVVDTFSPQIEEIEPMLAICEERGIRTYEVTGDLMAKIADTEHPQGIIAIVPIPLYTSQILQEIAWQGDESTRLPCDCRDVIVIADGVRDPGNLGTMLRSADAVGAKMVIVTSGSADPFQPKVVRSSAGSLTRVKVLTMKAEDVFDAVHEAGFHMIATDAHAANSLFAVDLAANIALVIGGEAQGVSRIARQKADVMVHLPMPGHTESLNAGVTCSVMLYEALRRRLA